MPPKPPSALFLLLLLLALALAGAACMGAAVTDLGALPDPEPAAGAQTSPDPTVTAAPAGREPNDCLDCHTDQQRLVDTADPEPVVEAENQGEG